MILKHKIKPLEPDHSFETVVRQDYIDNFGVDPEDTWSGKQAPGGKTINCSELSGQNARVNM